MIATSPTEKRNQIRERLTAYWCQQTGRQEAHGMTISIVMGYVEKYGEEVVFPWVDVGAKHCPSNDRSMGKYISKNRWNYLLETSI
jgi:hypothetical protein